MKLEFSGSSRFMLGVVGLTLVIFVCAGFDSLEDCLCGSRTKQDRYPGSWVTCIDGKPVVMSYYKDFPVPFGSPGGANPADWDCTNPNSPRYKGSSTAPYPVFGVSGPLEVSGRRSGEGGPEKTRAAGAGQVAYLPPILRDLPFLPTGPSPPGACDPSMPDVFRTAHTQSKVTRISTCPFQVKATIPVVSRPLQIAITPDGSTALVTSFDNAVNFIDVATNKVVFTLRTSPDVNPHGLAITPDGAKAYITSFDPFNPVVQVIDLATRAITATFMTGLQYPQGATLTPDGAQLWITGPLDGVVEVYDTASNTLLARVNAGSTTDVAFNSTGTRAFITSQTNQPGGVVVVDTATFQVLKTYPVGNGPTDIEMSYADQFLVVNNDLDGSVSVIDLIEDKVKTTKVGSSVTGIAFVR